MLKPLSLLIIINIFFCTCSTKKNGPYFLKDKWITSYLPYSPLRNNPKEVYEYFYRGINDINVGKLPAKQTYDYSKFNDQGDILEYVFHLSLDSGFKNKTIYTADGYKREMYDQSTGGYEVKPGLEMQRVGANIFKLTSNGKSQQKYIEYAADGTTITIQDTSVIDGETYYSKELMTYNGQRLIRQERIFKAGATKLTNTYDLYYSAQTFLDSIINKQAGYLVNKTVFTNNKYGDPIAQFTINSSYDTITKYRRQFTYDDKNNWIRMVEEEVKVKNNNYSKTPNGLLPYFLINREIIY